MRTAYLVVAFAIGLTAGFVARGRHEKPVEPPQPTLPDILTFIRPGDQSQTVIKPHRQGTSADSADVDPNSWRVVLSWGDRVWFYEATESR